MQINKIKLKSLLFADNQYGTNILCIPTYNHHYLHNLLSLNIYLIWFSVVGCLIRDIQQSVYL